MNKDEQQDIAKRLYGAFQKTPDTLELTAWQEYLGKQDYDVALYVASDIIENSDLEFMPKINYFSAQVKDRQREISRKAAKALDAGKCKQCSGTLWVGEWSKGYKPCSECNPSAFTRWQADNYMFGEPITENQGPENSYPAARSSSFNSGPRVSVARAKQWEDHIRNKLTGYPENPDNEESEKVNER